MDAHAAGQTYDCKQPGCTNEARSPVGRYSYCAVHQGRGKRVAAAGGLGSVEARIKSLAGQARAVDKAKAKAKLLTEQALAAKRCADEAEREFESTMRDVLGEGDSGVRVVA